MFAALGRLFFGDDQGNINPCLLDSPWPVAVRCRALLDIQGPVPYDPRF